MSDNSSMVISERQNILVTGGLGHFGSNVVIELINRGYQVIILDNLSNSTEQKVERIRKSTGTSVTYVTGDVGNPAVLGAIFTQYKIDLVIHLAGLKLADESKTNPLLYYDHNIGITLMLLYVMKKFKCNKLIFAYGSDPDKKFSPRDKVNNIITEMLKDLTDSDLEWTISILSYFGAGKSNTGKSNRKAITKNLLEMIGGLSIPGFYLRNYQ
jgi:UDP-glucose 4-epimerase